jgi:hypothetical protein
MVEKKYEALWEKIAGFSFDEPEAAFTFSQKLANVQTWSPAFTKRVIEEYRKFILLCCISEKGASPSQTVDEAWHLHLTYTKSYWIDFCKNTLGKEIHHQPSKGGPAENAKQEEWYIYTLKLYETVFNQQAPPDIWPQAKKAIALEEIPAIPIGKQSKMGAVAVAALPFLYLLLFHNTLNPFHLKGLDFLLFYFFYALAIIVIYLIFQKARESILQPWIEMNLPTDASVFQLAKFLYGKHRAVQAAIVDFIRRDLMLVNRNKTLQLLPNKYVYPEKEENPLAGPFLKEPNDSTKYYETIISEWYNEELFNHPKLALLFKCSQQNVAGFERIIYWLVLLGMGGIRLGQGLYNGKPIIYLIAEIILFGISYYGVSNWFSIQNLVFKNANALLKERNLQQGIYRD